VLAGVLLEPGRSKCAGVGYVIRLLSSCVVGKDQCLAGVVSSAQMRFVQK